MRVSNRSIKEKLNKSIESSTPNVLPDVLQYMEDSKAKNSEIININIFREVTPRKESVFRRSYPLKLASLALAFMVFLGLKSAYNHLSTESIISFDVSPSIEIKVNSFEKVLKVNPLNEDARVVLGNMNFKNTDLDIAVNALIGSMVENGYISSIKNSILISVDSQKKDKAHQIQDQLSEEINILLSQHEVNGAVLSQSINKDSNIKKIAKEHNISTGKAALIQTVVSIDNNKELKEMASLSINDLNLLIEDKYTSIQGVSKLGAANDSYIGKDKAKEIALAHINIGEDKALSLEIERDYKNGLMVYEVEFKIENKSYEFKIDAISGKILTVEENLHKPVDKPVDKPDNPDPQPNPNPNQDIGPTKAKEIALNHAGLKEDHVSKLEVKENSKDGIVFYQVGFDYSDLEFEYKIDAKTGKILKVESKNKPPDENPEIPENPGDEKPGIDQLIGPLKAKEIALNHAGLKEYHISKLEIEEKDKNATRLYLVGFDYSDLRFEYDIDAKTGKILKVESKNITKPEIPPEDKPVVDNLYIGKSKAKEIALKHAALEEDHVSKLAVEQKDKKGDVIYQVEFSYAGLDFQYEIEAKTGKILKVESKT